MYGKESKEDGEIRFHYHREERTGIPDEKDTGPKRFRLFKMNRSTMIILLDVISLTVIFLIFRPALTGRDHILETDFFHVEASAFRFDDKAYITVAVAVTEKTVGGEVLAGILDAEGLVITEAADTIPGVKGEERLLRFEIPVSKDARDVLIEVRLPGMEEPAVLTAVLKE